MTCSNGAVPGLRAVRPETLAARLAGGSFDGLPAGTGKSALQRALKEGGRHCGLSRVEVDRLVYLVQHTMEIDWCDDESMPVVWRSVGRMAHDLGCSVRWVNEIERRLEESGWITHRDSGNRHRWGERDPETGCVVRAYGVDLRPLGARYQELVAAAEGSAAEWRERKAVRADSSALRNEIRGLHATLGRDWEAGPRLPDRAPFQDLLAERDRLVAIRDELAQALRMTDDCSEAQDEAGGASVALPGGVDAGAELEVSGVEDADTSAIRNKSSAWAEPDCRSIPIHTESVTTGNRPPAPDDGAGPDGVPCEDTAPADAGDTGPGWKQRDDEPDFGVRHLQPGRVAAAASARFRQLAGDDPGWRDIAWAAAIRREELGIHDDAWRRAGRALGVRAVTVLVAVIDGRCQEKATFVWNPSGFALGCVARAAAGGLHLHKSIWGLEVRRRQREAWSPYEDPRWLASEASRANAPAASNAMPVREQAKRPGRVMRRNRRWPQGGWPGDHSDRRRPM